MPHPALRETLTFTEAVDLLRLINDVADDKEWSMVSGHFQVWSQVMMQRRGIPIGPRRGRMSPRTSSKNAEAWLRHQLEGPDS